MPHMIFTRQQITRSSNSTWTYIIPTKRLELGPRIDLSLPLPIVVSNTLRELNTVSGCKYIPQLYQSVIKKLWAHKLMLRFGCKQFLFTQLHTKIYRAIRSSLYSYWLPGYLFRFLPGRYWLHFVRLVVTWQDGKLINCFNLFECTSVSGQWWQQIIIYFNFISGIIFFGIQDFQACFWFFYITKIEVGIQILQLTITRKKKLQKLAASRYCWSLQICHYHFGNHCHQKIIMTNSVEKQFLVSLTTPSKG